jgi:nitrite reductase/ring-hydroxylating ferredoxin subunit
VITTSSASLIRRCVRRVTPQDEQRIQRSARARSRHGICISPVTHDHPVMADGPRLVKVDRISERGAIEVETPGHGVLAVGILRDGTTFAVSNICRHQVAKPGRGRVTEDGCLQCPWHRADYNVITGAMTSGPRDRVFGFTPYSAAVEAFGNLAQLRTFDVDIRDGAVWLAVTADHE